ncbi:PD-(D/E)XK nuclease family protein [Burkholderia pseudomallei]|uniref:PDDEXK-like family protein n=1 Tax=Burkholderia pseudomallei TaxID=28450 RepID=UPI000F06AD5E|nr:PD-(D/E)XK nuclease family protein [Burkholderia pseudomallei]VBT19807.1 Uncharacterised protein [Burkholderia pseudomallei]
MTPQDFYSFLSDARLVSLVERVKISDDFLDVVTLSETQHSDMLAWCLHPNEGHGQGDAVVKDFLIAAYNAAATTARYSNKPFFEKWTPGRIRTTSFGSSFIAREFSVDTGESKRKNRLDLFLIDPTNRIVVTIENKAGASLTESQLNTYYGAVSSQIGSRPVFKDYDFAYVVVDQKLANYTDEQVKALGNKWALLDYDWLKSSADRARRHMERNNQAAQLLMAYCEKQTGWQSPNEKHVSELSAELASQYEAVVKAIRLVRRMRPTEWTPTSFNGELGELLLFFQQNRQLCDHLVQAQGIGSVLVGLRKALPSLSLEDIEHSRTWLRFSTAPMQAVKRDADGYWPLYLNIFRETKGEDENSKFTLRLIWVTEHFSENGCDVEALRAHMAQGFPGLEKFNSSAARKVVIETKLNADAVVKRAVEAVTEIESRITSARNNGLISFKAATA